MQRTVRESGEGGVACHFFARAAARGSISPAMSKSVRRDWQDVGV